MNTKREKDNVIDDSSLWQAVERAKERRRALGIEEPETDFPAAAEKWILAEQLEKDYEEARRQAVFTHRVRLVLIVVGSVVIIGGAVGVVLGQTAAGALSAASGVLAEVSAVLFSKLSDDANKRMNRYHKELLKLYMEQK